MKKLLTIFPILILQLLQAVPLPVERFVQNPSFSSFQISPDGKYVAGLTDYHGAMNIVVFDLKNRVPQVLTGQKMDVTNFYWVNSQRLFYTINQGEATLDAQRNAGSIFAVDVDGGNHKPILDSLFERRKRHGERHRGIIHVVEHVHLDDEYVLVENYSRRSNYPDLYRMNVRNGTFKKICNNPGYIISYFYDIDGTVLGGFSQEDLDDETSGAVYWVDKKSGEWIKVMDIESIFDAPEFIGLSADRSKVIVSKEDSSGAKKLYEMSFDGEFREKLIFEDPVYDLAEIKPLLSLKTKGVIGIRYDREKPVNHFFNQTYSSLYQMIDDAIPDSVNYVYDFDDAGEKLLINSISDRKSPEYFLLDLKGGTLEPLGKMFPNLDGLYLPEKMPIKFTARDGHLIHGYLMLPEGYKADDRVALIVNPHGGPWARDKWGIRWWHDLEPVFLVSRGFAVLQVNFRASTGYGKEHKESSFKNLDLTMNDIWDGVNWAIDAGYADKDRIGIMGASFGGTATMLSLVHQPDMFQFGINIFGVVDFPEQIKTYYEWDRKLAADYWIRAIGDPKDKEERKNLDRWSAINYVENIKVPLFMYHGVVDQNVDVEQTRALEKKLKSVGKKKGVDYFVTYNSDEAHGMYNPESRIALYKAIDEFLKPFAPVYQN